MEESGGENTEGEKSINVEAKTFSCLCSNGHIVFKESHRKGTREITLTGNQAQWISKGLLERNQGFGETRLRESIAIDGRVVSLIEGSNQRGCFLSIQLDKGHAEPSFLAVPAGRRGVQWRKLAHLIVDGITGIEGHQTVNNSGESHKNKEGFRHTIGTSNRSYSDVVMNRNLDLNLSEKLRLNLEELRAMRERLEQLEKDVAELRLCALPATAAATITCPNPGNMGREMTDGRRIMMNPAVQIKEPNLTCDTEKRSNDESVPIRTPISCVSQAVICENKDGNRTVRVLGSISDNSNMEKNSNSDNSIRDNFSNNTEVDIAQMVDDQLNLLIEVENDDPEIKWIFIDPVYKGALRRLCITTLKEIISTRTSSSDEEGSTSTEGDQEDNTMEENNIEKGGDISYIIWDGYEEVFVHLASGIRYWPQGKVYYTFVSDDTNDFRRLYYNFEDGILKLIQKGKPGDFNREVMQDKEWDRSYMFTKDAEGYHPDLESFFKIALGKKDSKK